MIIGNDSALESQGDEAESGQLGTCALCDRGNAILKLSHSIPKFAFDWVKETSKTGFLRDYDDVNARQQDGPKQYLICGTCEGNLSKIEKVLSEKCFKKVANYQKQKSVITVTEEMRVAVLSIFWRALLTTKERSSGRLEVDEVMLDKFLADAKSQILARHCRSTIFIAPFVGDPPYYGLGSGFTYNLERGIGGQDARFFDDPHRAFIVFKLPFMYFYIFLGSWSGDETAKATEFAAGNIQVDVIREIPDTLIKYIKHLQRQFDESKAMMSESNMQKIREDAGINPNITGSDKSLMRSLN